MLETNRLLIRNFVAEDAHSCFEGWGKDKKLGFQFDGELRNRRIDFVSGERKNLVICSITKEDMVIEDIAMDILEIMKERYR